MCKSNLPKLAFMFLACERAAKPPLEQYRSVSAGVSGGEFLGSPDNVPLLEGTLRRRA